MSVHFYQYRPVLNEFSRIKVRLINYVNYVQELPESVVFRQITVWRCFLKLQRTNGPWNKRVLQRRGFAATTYCNKSVILYANRVLEGKKGGRRDTYACAIRVEAQGRGRVGRGQTRVVRLEKRGFERNESALLPLILVRVIIIRSTSTQKRLVFVASN